MGYDKRLRWKEKHGLLGVCNIADAFRLAQVAETAAASGVEATQTETKQVRAEEEEVVGHAGQD